MRTSDAAETYAYEYEITPEGEFRWLSSSKELLRMVGFDETDAASADGWKKAVDPGDQEAASEIVARLASGRPWEGRFRVRAKDGRRLVLDLRNEVEKMPDGRVLVHGHARDVTGDAERERALEEGQTRLRLLMQTIPVVLWSTDRDLRFTWGAGSGLQSLGLSGNELVGMSLYEYFGVDDPGFMPIEAHLRALKGETVEYDVEWQGREYRASVEPFRDEMGRIDGVVGVAVDITETSGGAGEARAVGRDVAHLRLATGDIPGSSAAGSSLLEHGELSIDLRAHRVTKRGQPIDVTPTEFKLLVELASHPDELIGRDDLLQAVWGQTFAGESPLWMTVKRLREKIEDDPHRPRWIETVRGLGYRFTTSSTNR